MDFAFIPAALNLRRFPARKSVSRFTWLRNAVRCERRESSGVMTQICFCTLPRFPPAKFHRTACCLPRFLELEGFIGMSNEEPSRFRPHETSTCISERA